MVKLVLMGHRFIGSETVLPIKELDNITEHVNSGEIVVFAYDRIEAEDFAAESSLIIEWID